MLDEWTYLPKWVKFGSAAVILGFSIYEAWHGRIWPWGLGVGGLLFLMSFMQPLGPRR